MKESTCPKCGQPVKPDVSGGLCPQCLMAMNLADPTELTGETGNQSNDRDNASLPDIDTLGSLFPHIDIIELLGRGGMGVVYKARQKSLDRLVALKILAPERTRDEQFAERFSREARILARLSQPNIVTIHDFGEIDGMCYLVMELVDGCSLRNLLKQGSLAPEKALAIVPAICSALEYAHGHGVVHRDIKPENVLIDRQGRVKIVDFGIAKILGVGESMPGNDGEGKGLTRAGRLGTPAYMAPEQEVEPTLVDHRADIYSLGVVFYEMLTGELPKESFDLPSKKVQVDVRIDEAVIRAIEKEPERRYQTAAELRSDLETAAAERGNQSPKDSGTWFPRRSVLANRILVHRTDAEKRSHFRSEVRLGLLWVIPLFLTYVAFDLLWADIDIEWVLVAQLFVLGALYPAWLIADRSELCSTEWAKARGISMQDLAWFQDSPWNRILQMRRLWRRVGMFLGVLGCLALVALFFGIWLQRPRPYGATISSTSPDEMVSVTAETFHAMRIFGGDESFYRFRVQAYAGSIHEQWEIPVPYQLLAQNYVLLALDSIVFDPHGSIVWSEDSQRVSFRVNGFEVSAFNVVDGSHSFEAGYQRQHEVVLRGNDSLREAFLDLDEGLVLSAPSELLQRLKWDGQLSGGAPQLHWIQDWMNESGADLVFRPGIGLTMVHGVVMGAEKEGIDGDPRAFDTLSVERARKAVHAVEEAVGEFPDQVNPILNFRIDPDSVGIVKTTQGGIGLVEILEGADESKLKVRFKMIAP